MLNLLTNESYLRTQKLDTHNCII